MSFNHVSFNTLTKMRGSALNRVHNSRRPLDRLQYSFALYDSVTLTFDFTFPKIQLGDLGSTVNSPSGAWGRTTAEN